MAVARAARPLHCGTICVTDDIRYSNPNGLIYFVRITNADCDPDVLPDADNVDVLVADGVANAADSFFVTNVFSDADGDANFVVVAHANSDSNINVHANSIVDGDDDGDENAVLDRYVDAVVVAVTHVRVLY